MRITKKAKRELCQKIINKTYKKENKVLNLYDLLKLDYEILLIYEKCLNKLFKDKFILLNDFINFENHKIQIEILFNKTTNNKFLLELNLNNRFKKDFEFNDLNQLINFLNNFNKKEFENLTYL